MARNKEYRLLGELVEVFDYLRKPVKESERNHGIYPYYGASGIVDYVDDYLFDGQYLLIAEDGENLRTKNTPIAFIASGKFWVNNHAHILQGNDLAETKYLLYALLAQNIDPFLHGAVMPKLTQADLLSIPIQAPPIEKQRAIASILGSLDDKIELNRKTCETLEEMARATFKSWFVDFDPVRAKINGEKPASICARLGITREILDLFPNKLVDSELGEIPEGWMSIALSDLAKLSTEAIAPYEYPEEYFDHYSIPSYDLDRLPAKDRGQDIKSNKYIVIPNSVLVSKLNPETPRVWLPLVGEAKTVCSTEFMQFVPNNPKHRVFIYGLLTSSPVQEAILCRITGSTGSRQRAQPMSVAAMSVVKPHSDAIRAYNVIIAPLLAKAEKKRTEGRLLAGLRDELLPKLISGEIEVPVNGGEK